MIYLSPDSNIIGTYDDFLVMLSKQNKISIDRHHYIANEVQVQQDLSTKYIAEAEVLLKTITDDKSHDEKKSIFRTAFSLYQKSQDVRYEKSTVQNAIPLEQRFAAISDNAALNAINVISCIFLVLVDSQSKTTLGAHIDHNVSSESIINVIHEFLTQLDIPKEKQKDYPLVCHLVGGDSQTKEYEILKKIYDGLNKFTIELGSSLVTDSGWLQRPNNICYDPLTARFSEAMVSHSNTDRQLQLAVFTLTFHIKSAAKTELSVFSLSIKGQHKKYSFKFSREDILAKKLPDILFDMEKNIFKHIDLIIKQHETESFVMAVNSYHATSLYLDKLLSDHLHTNDSSSSASMGMLNQYSNSVNSNTIKTSNESDGIESKFDKFGVN